MSTRWRVAYALDRSRRFCWADLVMWALRYDGYTLRGMRDSGADRCAAECPSCWCGKFRGAES